jgi:hypothetical protein
MKKMRGASVPPLKPPGLLSIIPNIATPITICKTSPAC